MKFAPRDEFEREAFDIEPPKFDIDDRVKVAYDGRQWEGVITDIYIRTVNWPLWMYQVDNSESWFDAWMLARKPASSPKRYQPCVCCGRMTPCLALVSANDTDFSPLCRRCQCHGYTWGGPTTRCLNRDAP